MPRAGAWHWCLLCLLCLWTWGLCGEARAQGHAEITQMQVERTPEGMLLSAALAFDLPEHVEDALRKGITMHFVLQAQVLRERWYWSDLEMAHAARYLRLSYQPLTRRWRLHISPEPLTGPGQGLALAQTYDELADAIGAMQRVARWKIADSAQVPEDLPVTVQMRFGLDLSQLPRPLQIGAFGRSGWILQMSQSLRLAGGGLP
ncbi:DUF4390 domain-containing protein [Comamonas endophytica]|uniref:DUF4390 domain-containing protein n=1 Tax=Comamonas endophytica TaxID=2949090 RepID=A0ABY6GDL9_9BURK|nr:MULTISPECIES: DUF4390 domain-containing protein [unclassified Acidovorax]MCD2512669.1 DUF4390 domain-containing protein [Acidovorax sp. D4N7]UYG52973.1 DUF4390 domain-containing protein [Acidovorax sp. 5MLIR]